MQDKTNDPGEGLSSRLQRSLADRILAEIRARDVPPGTRLTEQGLAQALGVSRTPIRAALGHLASRGVVAHAPHRGFTLQMPAAEIAAEQAVPAEQAEDELTIAIAAARLTRTLPDQVSEADLLRRFEVSRPLLTRVLGRLEESAVVERRPGYGWQFLPMLDDQQARAESYRFRCVTEPAALLEPGFALDPAWVADMRARHRQAMADDWHPAASVGFFEMNAAFHAGLAQASGNRFYHLSALQQNRLRRFRNYDWRFGHDRVLVNSREHLEILDRLEQGEHEIASLLLRRHIERAGRLVSGRD